MTEEELEKKSEENWDKCILRDIKEPEHWAIHEHHVQAYIDGYTQCATDINVVTTHTDNTEVILNLQKENEELKGQVEWLEKCELELGEMLGKANNQVEEIANINIKAQTIIAEQKQQIEKMKCCQNCKHFDIDDNERLNCVLQFIHCKNHDKWELVE